MLYSERLKILVVVPDIEIGGVTSSCINFCHELVNNNNEVDILVMDGSDVKLEDARQIKLTGRSSYWNLSKKDLLSINCFNRIGLSLIGIIKKFSNRLGLWYPIVFNRFRLNSAYDVAVAYRQCAPCYYFTLNCINARRKIAMIHGNLHFMGDTGTWDKFLPQFDSIACVSNAVERDFRNRFVAIKEKFTTIYNMFDRELIRKKADQSCQYDVDGDLINIVSVTRHENGHKKVNRIIQACAILRERGFGKFHWYIVGDGPDFNRNKDLAEELGVTDCITFCGALRNPFPMIKKCDFLVLTSATEAYGMVIREAQILSKPAIAMEFDGINEVIRDDYDGIVVKQDIYSLCDVLGQLIEDPERIEALANNMADVSYGNEQAYAQFLKAIN